MVIPLLPEESVGFIITGYLRDEISIKDEDLFKTTDFGVLNPFLNK